MKSSFCAVGWEKVNKSLDYSLLHAVCCVHIFTTQYTLDSSVDTSKRSQKVRPLLQLPYNTNSGGIGVISMGNGSTKQWNN